MKFLANDFLDNFERDAARKNERYTLVFGTHLNNTSARDISQFPQDQGATTKARLLRSKEETTRVLRKLAISHAGCGDFLVPPRCGCVAVALATASLPRLADLPAGRQVQENLSQRGQEVLLRWVLSQ